VAPAGPSAGRSVDEDGLIAALKVMIRPLGLPD
jgi:hypothetical protein